MITPNTLQIGNLIQLSYGQVAKVVAVHEDFVDVQIEGVKEVRRDFDSLSGLEITEDRLRDAGFIQTSRPPLLDFCGVLFWSPFSPNEFAFDDQCVASVQLTAWHDLQNLVRLISGKDI